MSPQAIKLEALFDLWMDNYQMNNSLISSRRKMCGVRASPFFPYGELDTKLAKYLVSQRADGQIRLKKGVNVVAYYFKCITHEELRRLRNYWDPVYSFSLTEQADMAVLRVWRHISDQNRSLI